MQGYQQSYSYMNFMSMNDNQNDNVNETLIKKLVHNTLDYNLKSLKPFKYAIYMNKQNIELTFNNKINVIKCLLNWMSDQDKYVNINVDSNMFLKWLYSLDNYFQIDTFMNLIKKVKTQNKITPYEKMDAEVAFIDWFKIVNILSVITIFIDTIVTIAININENKILDYDDNMFIDVLFIYGVFIKWLLTNRNNMIKNEHNRACKMEPLLNEFVKHFRNCLDDSSLDDSCLDDNCL